MATLPDAVYLQADLADPDQATQLIDRSLEHYGQLDVLVNNAGISRVIDHADLASATPAVWRELLDVNLIGPWVLTTAAVPSLERDRARPRRHPAHRRLDNGSRILDRERADATPGLPRRRCRPRVGFDRQSLHHRRSRRTRRRIESPLIHSFGATEFNP